MRCKSFVYAVLTVASTFYLGSTIANAANVEVGPRPYFLVETLKESPLKNKLESCANNRFKQTTFSIGHRGAAMMFPEHTAQSYEAAGRMGAGIIECDVTFTKDKELVCRHSQSDLHTTTNILKTPLASKCTEPFKAATTDQKATAECRTSDISLAEYKTLKGKMDAANTAATTLDQYMNSTANWRTDLYAESRGTVMTHAESIQLIKSMGAKFTPELKTPSVKMPFNGFTQEDFAQKMIDEYKAAGIPARDVWAQSFNLADIQYWIKNEPEFGKQAVYLYEGEEGFDHLDPKTFKPSMADLKKMGVNYIAPAMWILVTTDQNGKIIPSPYAIEAKKAGLNIITWTLERSGPLKTGGGWYYQSIKDVTKDDGVMLELLDVLAKDVGIKGIFSDWPATVTYYANCMGL